MGTCLKLRPKAPTPIPAAIDPGIHPVHTSAGCIHIYIYKAYTHTRHTHKKKRGVDCRSRLDDNLDERINGEKKTGTFTRVELSLRQYISYRIDRQSISCKTLHFIVGKGKKTEEFNPSLSTPPSPSAIRSNIPLPTFNPSVNESVTMITSNFYKCIFSPPSSPPRVENTPHISMIIVEAPGVNNLRTFLLEPLPRGRRRSNQHVQ